MNSVNPVYKFLAWMICFAFIFALPAQSQPPTKAATPSPRRVFTTDTGLYPQDWWAQVQENLAKSEYSITWQDTTYLSDIPAAYQAPNRENNLRTYFTENSIVVIPRLLPEGVENLPWRWEMRLVSEESALQAMRIDQPASMQIRQNRITYFHYDEADASRPAITECYQNDDNGLTQEFTIESPDPASPANLLWLKLVSTGNLTASWIDQGKVIAWLDTTGKPQLLYKLIQATDTSGVNLPARIRFDNTGISLEVESTQALFPIEIELQLSSLPQTPDWSLGLGQNGARFGFSVATAGDTNGDGFSDVIIGAPFYDGGLTDEGRAEVYLGWVTGLSLTPTWTKESNQADAHYGRAVATAGDVNGDGYADILVGAPEWDASLDAEGAAWVYHGSSSGPESDPAAYRKGNQAGPVSVIL